MAAQHCCSCWLPFVVLFWLYVVSPVVAGNACPSECSCLYPMVDCSQAGLKEIPTDLPDWAQILELSTNEIEQIPEKTFDQLRNLEEINLGKNKLTYVNTSIFSSLNKLETLKLPFNELTAIPVLPHNSTLTQLFLSNNQISHIRRHALERLPRLRMLDLNYNQIKELRTGVFPKQNNLKQLYLNSNLVHTVEHGALNNLTALEWLKMNRNKLQHLDKDTFGDLAQLRHLELNRNRFEKLEGLTFRGLKNLVALKLRRNKISHLMDGVFYGLESVQMLQLDNNNISAVTKNWLYGLSSLGQLDLSHNVISTIDPTGWEVCKKQLWELNLGHNRLSVIEQSTFVGLTQLQYLYINSNQLSYVEAGSFSDLGVLKALDLGQNQIWWTVEDTEGLFDGLKSLSRLVLDNNRIQILSVSVFAGLSQLRVLHLLENPISAIADGAFLPLESLQEIRLNATGMLCDCQLSWLPHWLHEAQHKETVAATCAWPPHLKANSIFNLSQEDFVCDDSPIPVLISEPPTPQITLKGENVSLQCVADSTANIDVVIDWRKDNRVLKNAKVINRGSVINGTTTRMSTTLLLPSIQDSDAGMYLCVISNTLGTTTSTRVQIDVHVRPSFIDIPSDVTVRAGLVARLECTASGQPQPQIAWQKDGGNDFPAARERRMRVMQADDAFSIIQVKSEDEGVYSCMASNAAGTIVANATLRVLEIPKFSKAMEPEHVVEGETAVIECLSAGSPQPLVEWQKDGRQLDVTDRHFFTGKNQLLIIVETIPSDAGIYTCIMSNTVGTTQGDCELTVLPLQHDVGPGDGFSQDSTTTGIIIIAVVCCVVGTSLVWVIIIYKTRKKGSDYNSTDTDHTGLPGEVPEMTYHARPEYSHLPPGTVCHSHDGRSGLRFPGQNGRSGAIFPSDVDTDENHQFRPLTMDMQQNSDISDCSSALRLPGSDAGSETGHSSSSTYSSHSTRSTTLLHTFHPTPTASQLLYGSQQECPEMDPGSSSSWPHHHQQDDLDEPPPPWPHHHHLTDHSFPPPPSPLTQRTLCDTSGSDTPEADEAPEGDPHMCSPLVENPRMSGHHSEVHLAEPHYTGSEAATGSVCATATFPLSHNPQATQAGWPPQTSLPASPKERTSISGLPAVSSSPSTLSSSSSPPTTTDCYGSPSSPPATTDCYGSASVTDPSSLYSSSHSQPYPEALQNSAHDDHPNISSSSPPPSSPPSYTDCHHPAAAAVIPASPSSSSQHVCHPHATSPTPGSTYNNPYTTVTASA